MQGERRLGFLREHLSDEAGVSRVVLYEENLMNAHSGGA